MWRICGAIAENAPTRTDLTELVVQNADDVATSLYVPIPSKPSRNSRLTDRFPPSLLSYGVRNRPNQPALVPFGPLTSLRVRYSPHLSASVRIGLCLSPALVPRIATPAQDPNVFARTPRNSVAFPNRHCDIHTPHMMMSISKSLPRNFGEDPEHVAQPGRRQWLQTPNSYPDRIWF